jgi:endonuclease/exonuclease/phosphatase family metal-dependent hydrolase
MLRLATYNVLSGRAPGADPAAGFDPEPLARSVAALDADVVALQEVDSFQPRSGSRDQVSDLLEALSAGGTPWAGRFLPTLHGTPALSRQWSAATSEPGGEPGRPSSSGPSHGDPLSAAYGIALLSRLPVTAWHSQRLMSSWGRLPMLIPTPKGRVVPLLIPDEPRAALGATVETELGPMTVIGTHLSFLPLRAVRQLRRLTRWAGTLPGESVLVGDLNLPGRLPTTVTGWRQLSSRPTFPKHRPRTQLDHVLTPALAGLRVVSAQVVPGEVSDHCAVVVDLTR